MILCARYVTLQVRAASIFSLVVNLQRKYGKKTLATHGISRNPSMWGNELRWLKTNCKGRNVRAKLIRVLFSCTVYMIWWERNKRIFAQESHNPLEVFEGISNFFRLIL